MKSLEKGAVMQTEEKTMGRPENGASTAGTAYKCVWIFGVWNAVLLVVLVASAATGGAPSTFMWVRAGILLAVAPLLVKLARNAEGGRHAARRRLRTVSVILPIAVVVIDFIPGVAPVWYSVLQGTGALLLVPVAVLMTRAARGDGDT
ncbi:hypothetical protein ACX9R5_17905 [Rathayibacter sp. CAU 1779]